MSVHPPLQDDTRRLPGGTDETVPTRTQDDAGASGVPGTIAFSGGAVYDEERGWIETRSAVTPTERRCRR